jgi:hypothetical protein
METTINALMKLMTTRESANDKIWLMTEKVRETIERRQPGFEVHEIDIWPEDGIEFNGWIDHPEPVYHEELVTWEEYQKIKDKHD